MPYIGRGPSKSGAFRILKDFSARFDGSATSFAIQDTNGTALSVATPQNLMIAVDGVMQEPGSAYTISGTNIVFGSAPLTEATFWGVELGDIGGTSVSSSDQILVVATGHSFVVGRWMKATSTDGVYAYADCTTEPNAEVAGVIISVTTDTYTLQVHGTVTGDAVPAQAGGTIMFLDDSNGQMTTTETSTVGEVSKPLAIVTKNDSEMVILTYRGEVVSSSVQTNAPNNATYLTTTANSTLTAEVVVGSTPGGELGGTWSSPTVDSTHSGSAHHAEAHGIASHSNTSVTDAELNLLDGGTSVGSSITIADADGFIVNDGGTMKTVPASDVKTYAGAASPINARVYNNAAQNISNTTWTVLAFNSERFDTGGGATSGLHHNSTNNSRFTIATAGVYTIWAGIEWQGNASGSFRIMRITLNGSTEIAHQSQPGAASGQRMSLSTIWSFSATDYVEVYVYQNSGSTLSIPGNNNYSSEFAIAKLD